MTSPRSSPDIVERLRKMAIPESNELEDILYEAAGEIERLRALAQPSQPSPGTSDLLERLRNRAKVARDELTGTALGDALHFEEAADEIERLLSSAQAPFQAIVNEQANDPALWCLEPTITEHMLQQALRRLHHAIEGTEDSSTEGKTHE